MTQGAETSSLDMKETVRRKITEAGACAVGFARAGAVDSRAAAGYAVWIGEGCHAGMDYLGRHIPLKADTESVLPGAATVICAAFSYAPDRVRDGALPVISCYAYGQDYHDVIRRRLTSVIAWMKDTWGGDWRICIDSAPVAERYWAMRSGIGRLARNGSVIVDGFGGMCFLAEILTTAVIEPDMPSGRVCEGCGACVRACPTGALRHDGTVDARRCLNYLTIEHRGPWEGEMREVMESEAGKKTLYGCDICQHICPHNQDIPPTEIEEFHLPDKLAALTAADVIAMSPADFSLFFKGSPIKRAKYEGLLRNALNILNTH